MAEGIRLTRRRLLERWWVLPVGATALTFAGMGLYATRVTRKRAVGAPDYQSAAPLRIAVAAQLGQDWAEVPFAYAGRPCLLLRLPAASPGSLTVGGRHYAAYSRVCTHLGCAVNLVRDPEVLAFSFGYRAPDPAQQYPHLGCPCHYSVFDPQTGGEAVYGKAYAPLPRVRLEARGGELWATGIEPAPGG